MVVSTANSADEWQEIASRSFVPLECDARSSTFRASINDVRLSSHVSVCDISSDAAVITRTPRLTARAVSDDLHLSVQVRSAGRIHQGSTGATMRPGSVAVYTTHLPYRLDYFASGQRIIVVQISRAALGLSSQTISSASAAIAIADTAGRRVFTDYVRALVTTPDRHDGQARDDFARITADLATTMLRTSEAGRRVVPDSPDALLCTIQSFMREQARSADLTLDEVARAHYISRRKLYELFAQVSTTPSVFLRDERLRVAAGLLADPGLRLPVAAIAQRCGFTDVTTFTRAFRRRYEMTPREWRRAHR